MKKAVLLVLALQAFGLSPAMATDQRLELSSRGLEITALNWGRPSNVVHVAKVLSNTALEIKVLPALPEKGLERPSEICARYSECLAAINGDMFDRRARQPLGGMVADGRVIHPAKPSYRQLNLMGSKPVMTEDGAIPPGTWQSIGISYPVLWNGGLTSIPEDTSFVWGAEARTLAGWNDGGEFFLVTVDQGRGYSRGVSLAQAAELMKQVGATNAVNLDGGESTTFVIGGKVINKPWSGEQAVANVLAVFPKPKQPEPTLATAEDMTTRAGFEQNRPQMSRHKSSLLAVVLIVLVGSVGIKVQVNRRRSQK